MFDLLRWLKIVKIVKIFENCSSSMDDAENRASSDSNVEDYNLRIYTMFVALVLVGFITAFVLAFCMVKGNRGLGENSLVGFRKTKNVQYQCRHTCRVNSSTCNAIFNDKSNRNRHEKNPNQHPNCEHSTCTTMRHHEQLEEAREQAEQLEQAGPPVARRLSSLASYASQVTNDDDEGGAREILSVPLNSTKRRRKNASEPKLSDPVIVMNNAVGLINELQQRSGARRPLIAALFSGVQQESAAAAIGCGLRTVQRAFAESRDGNTAISNLFLFNDYVRYHVRESC
jgi:hypothetical protein